jgi:hypothetical protein
MMASNTTLGSSSQSVADYLVASIKPNFEVIRERFKGMTLHKRVYRLFPSEQNTTDLVSFIRQRDIALIHEVKSLPEWFDERSYVEKSVNQISAFVEGDRDLSRAMKRIVGKAGELDQESAIGYSEAFEILSKKMHATYEQIESENAFLFLKSKMPSEYFDLVNRAEVLGLARLDVIARRSKSLESQLHMASPRGFAHWSRIADNYKSEMSPLMAAGRLVSESVSRLDFYVDVNNAANIGELFLVKPLSDANLDKQEFGRYLGELDSALTTLQTELVWQPNWIQEPFELSNTTMDLQRSLANIVIA